MTWCILYVKLSTAKQVYVYFSTVFIQLEYTNLFPS